MAYSDFGLTEVREKLSLSLVNNRLFENSLPIQTSKWLNENLNLSLDFALKSGSEKARSEFIVAPILLEMERINDRQLYDAQLVNLKNPKQQIDTIYGCVTTGDRMAILQLEDLTGSPEAIVFPKTFDKVKHLLEKDKRLMVWGKIDRRDEQTQLIIDNMQPIESVRMVRVELTREQASDRQVLQQLKTALNPNPNYNNSNQNNSSYGNSSYGRNEPDNSGKIPVIAAIEYMPKLVRLGNQFWVEDEEIAVKALQKAGFKATYDALITK